MCAPSPPLLDWPGNRPFSVSAGVRGQGAWDELADGEGGVCPGDSSPAELLNPNKRIKVGGVKRYVRASKGACTRRNVCDYRSLCDQRPQVDGGQLEGSRRTPSRRMKAMKSATRNAGN